MKAQTMTLADGRVVNLTLNIGALADLSRKDHELYIRYITLYNLLGKKDGRFGELEMAEVLYIAYLCANDDPMTQEEFFYQIEDREEMGRAFQSLYTPKTANKGFQQPSGRKHGRRKTN